MKLEGDLIFEFSSLMAKKENLYSKLDKINAQFDLSETPQKELDPIETKYKEEWAKLEKEAGGKVTEQDVHDTLDIVVGYNE